jgi:hypothetical protein
VPGPGKNITMEPESVELYVTRRDHASSVRQRELGKRVLELQERQRELRDRRTRLTEGKQGTGTDRMLLIVGEGST